MEIKIFGSVRKPSAGTKISELNQYQKSDKAPPIIYRDLESLIQKVDEYKNNPGKSFATNLGEKYSV